MITVGTGRWDPGTYSSNVGASAAAGSSFAYSSSIKTGKVAAATHTLLDPKVTAGPTSPLAGQLVREARDNDDHPNSTPIMVDFDQTGSMQTVPQYLVTKLPELFNLVMTKGYIEDPQFSFGAYGDAENGRAHYGAGRETSPLQIGQFEADNRADETLDNLYLEGNGGGNGGETAALVWYYAAKHTASDAWDKRGKKGYLFTIGDEITLGVTRAAIEQYIGPDHGLEDDLTPEQVYALASERWEVFHLVINNETAASQRSVKFYSDLMGDHCVVLEDPANVCETIAVLIGLGEGTVDLDDALEDLTDVGANDSTKRDVGKALARFGGGKGAVAVAEAPTDLDATDSGVTRL